ncbi:MAG: restriction endonuclease subunit S [Sphingomonadales bacterium]|nr:MAG: restriction endonuclease subunit S [Sphingomonadales bacterium]
MLWAWPSQDEQAAIVTFLNTETSKIDALVAEQEELMALLKEKRQAVISHAVTKGLDPTVPMKGSGVEWLGDVPAHWEVRRVKDVAKLESGHTPSKSVPEYWVDCNIPWVSLNDSKQLAKVDYISDTEIQINALGLENSSARILPAGAVVFTRDATIGLAAITTRPMAVSQHLIAWLPKSEIDALYLLRVFNAMRENLDSYTTGATLKTIGMPAVRTLNTPVPPLEEQQLIAFHIKESCEKLESLIADVKKATNLLGERRSALISAAVTGKIDVRGALPC